MRAAVVYEHGGIDKIVLETDVADPVPEPDWVTVRVRACSLNYHDIFTRRGLPGIRVPLPVIVGSDIAGEIVSVGSAVCGWSTGDRVLIDPLPCSGTGGKFIGEHFPGGRAEFTTCHASQLLRLPDTVDFESAACLPLAYATAHRMLTTVGQLRAKERVLILGASGGVGTACVLLAKMLGAEVFACTSSDEKLERLRAAGADHCINYQKENFREAVWRLVGKPKIAGTGGTEVVINYTGGSTWAESLRCLGIGGRLLTCGATAGFNEAVDVRYVWTFELALRGSNGWRRSDLEALLEHVAAGRLHPVIDRILPLQEIHHAELLMERRELFGKIVIRP